MGTTTFELAEKTVRCVKITRPDIGGDDGYLILYAEFDEVQWELRNFLSEEINEDYNPTIKIEIVEMTERELEALPEFDGW